MLVRGKTSDLLVRYNGGMPGDCVHSWICAFQHFGRVGGIVDKEEKQFRFVVDSVPVSKSRPRFASGVVYTPQKTANFERLVKIRCRSCMKTKGIETFDKPVAVKLLFVMPVPKSYSNSKRQAMIGKLHTHKPDLDNLIKAVLDGMNGIAYRDDSLVCSIDAVKVYGATPKAVVTVEAFSK